MKFDVPNPAKLDSSMFPPPIFPDNVEVPKFSVNPAPVDPLVKVPTVASEDAEVRLPSVSIALSMVDSLVASMTSSPLSVPVPARLIV